MVSIARFNECTESDFVSEHNAQEVIVLENPLSNVELPYGITSKVGVHTINGSSVVLKNNVRLLGSNFIPFDEKNNILGYNVNSESYKDIFLHINTSALLASAQKSKQNYRVLDDACCLVNAWSKSYFHWLVELLPRLIVLRGCSDGLDSPVHIVINPEPTEWQLKSLELLGFPFKRIVCSREPLYVKRLFIPSFPLQAANGKKFSIISPEIITRMRDEMLVSVYPHHLTRVEPVMHGDRKIIVSRSKAAGRKVVNEEHLLHALLSYGFELFVLEDMSFEQQIMLFADAKVVIAPHGAGLTNLIFSRNDPTVIELYSGETNWNASFYTLASSLGFNYGLYKCKNIRSINRKRDNMLIDIPDFLRFYERYAQQVDKTA